MALQSTIDHRPSTIDHAGGDLVTRDRRAPAPGRKVEVDGLCWHVEEAGAGPDLLLLHGYLGSTAAWHRAMPILARSFHVIAADLPGAGYSDRPKDAPYDPMWLSGRFAGLLRHLGVRGALLGGHSLGAAVSIWTASRFPDLASGLVLVSPLAYRQLPPPGLRIAKKHPRLMGAFFSSPIGRLVIPSLVRRAAFVGPNARAAVNARRLLEHLDAPGGWDAATRMGLSAGDGAPGEAVLRTLSVPVLLVWGDSDAVHSGRYASRIRSDIPGPCTVVTLPHAGHNCHEEYPEPFARAVCDWHARFPHETA